MKKLIGKIILITLISLGCSHMPFGQLKLSSESYGKVIFGESIENIEISIGEKAQPEKRDYGCDHVNFNIYPGIKFMVEEGIITRGVTEDIKIENVLGIKIGSSLTEVKKRYPAVIVEPHAYDPTGHYLIFRSKDNKRAMVFEESDDKVTGIRGGLEPSVEYIEGCL